MASLKVLGVVGITCALPIFIGLISRHVNQMRRKEFAYKRIAELVQRQNERLFKERDRVEKRNHGLWVAVMENNLDAIREIVSTSPNINEDCAGSDRIRVTQYPLHRACILGRVECVKLLLQAGMDSNVRDGYHRTPLHEAVFCHSMECARLLTNYSLTGLDHVDNYGRTPLHVAARRGSSVMCEFLVRHGCYIDVVDDSNRTPLCFALTYGHMECAEVLVSLGANIHAVKQASTRPIWSMYFKIL